MFKNGRKWQKQNHNSGNDGCKITLNFQILNTMECKMKVRNDKEQAHCKLVHIDVLKSEKSVNGSTKLSDSNDDGFELPQLYYFVLVTILIIPIFPVVYLLIFLKRLFRFTRKKILLISG